MYRITSSAEFDRLVLNRGKDHHAEGQGDCAGGGVVGAAVPVGAVCAGERGRAGGRVGGVWSARHADVPVLSYRWGQCDAGRSTGGRGVGVGARTGADGFPAGARLEGVPGHRVAVDRRGHGVDFRPRRRRRNRPGDRGRAAVCGGRGSGGCQRQPDRCHGDIQRRRGSATSSAEAAAARGAAQARAARKARRRRGRETAHPRRARHPDCQTRLRRRATTAGGGAAAPRAPVRSTGAATLRKLLEEDRAQRLAARGEQAANASSAAPAAAAAAAAKPPSNSAAAASMQIRLPDGTHLVASFRSDQTLRHVLDYIIQERPELAYHSLTLSNTYPRKTYAADEWDTLTLEAAQLYPRGTLNVSRR
eukprot:ctg_336.g191